MALRRRPLLAAMAVACLLGGPAAADVDAGKQAYAKGDFATAKREFEAAANAGDADAQTRLAVLYLRGEGVEKNPETAAGLMKTAAEAKFPPAMMNLAKMYYHGIGVPQNKVMAAAWYAKAGELDEPIALHSLALLYLRGDGVPRDAKRGVTLLRQAAEFGLLDSQYQLGQLYESGFGVPKDLAQAYYWYFVAGQRRYLPAQGPLHEVAKQLDAETIREMELKADKFQVKERKSAKQQ